MRGESGFSAKRYSPAEIFGLNQLPSVAHRNSAFEIRNSRRREFRVSCFRVSIFKFPGGLTARVTPVPIPNTEVKPCWADDTALETTRERRSPPGLNSRAAFAKANAALFVLAQFL